MTLRVCKIFKCIKDSRSAPCKKFIIYTKLISYRISRFKSYSVNFVYKSIWVFFYFFYTFFSVGFKNFFDQAK